MKTSQVAAAVGKRGKVFAVERDEKRVKLLRKMLRNAGADQIVQAMHSDFTKISPSKYSSVEYIVLDPSCSGSGKHLNFKEFVNLKGLENLEIQPI